MKRVLITGGTSGMGLSAVRLFLEKGWAVMIVGIDEEKGEALRHELEDKGYDRAFFFKCDVTKGSEVKALYN